jgi:nicotinate-nucleotide--dimethylbenzimidazole phosphoribosyltransferase
MIQEQIIEEQIRKRLDSLTKPPGSLGRLEEIAVQYGLARGTAELRLDRKAMFVFCADHGIAAEGVSAYPREVTAQMVRNFVAGGAAINVLCRQYGIDAHIVDAGVDAEPEPGVIDRRLARGTRNFLHEPAMTAEQALQAIKAGREMAAMDYDLIGAGEMGIGNTTAAAAVVAALTGRDPVEVAGRGTGIDDAHWRHKVSVLRRALERHRPDRNDPAAVLAAVGGFEIGAIAGLILGAAEQRLAVVVDGFIATAGALIAARLHPSSLASMFFSHRSSEPGHAVALAALGARPILDLDMRLGEGTGAALAIGLIESAVRLYNEMATFDSAGVSRNDSPGPENE